MFYSGRRRVSVPTMRDPVSRRTVLATAASATTAVVAGCSDGSPDAGTDTETTTTGDEPYRNGVGADASVSFAVPSDETTFTSRSVQWRAEADGVTIEASGEVSEGAGHYHVLVDTDPVEPGETIPNDDAHVHYGSGQTDGVLDLAPGDHTLHLQVGDGNHTAMALTDTAETSVSQDADVGVETTVEGSVVRWEATVENYTIEPASEGVDANAGHLHAVVDSDPVPVGEVIPDLATHVHYGDGSTSGELDLEERLGEEYAPGEYTIYFQVGTATHRATTVWTKTTVTTE